MNRFIKICTGLARLYSPAPVQKWLSSKKELREANKALSVAQNYRISRDDFLSILQQLDLSTYKTVFLHTSVSNIGKVQGGAKYMAQSVVDLVDTSKRTLLVSALSYRGSFYQYLKSHDTFDVRTAPIAMGSINEILSRYPNAERSIHPTHSVVALGSQAHQYVSQHHIDPTPFGVHSPYYQLIKDRGVVLLLGATLNNLTFIHAIEDLLGDALPSSPYSHRRFTIHCTDWNGQEVLVETLCHSPLKGVFRDLSQLEEPMTECGALHSWPLGAGSVSLIDVQGFTTRYLELMRHGVSIYGHHFVSKKLAHKIDEVQEFIQSIK